ncbi:hypothetical protein [Streptomyces cinereoruber]|uniref:hypothetical protein n=1 Tax=Streptomyces cinereoruber TaxID=67260 RepID=UPI003C2FC8FF
MWGCLLVLLGVGLVGKLLVVPLTTSDLMAAQTPAHQPTWWEWAVLVAVSVATAVAVAWSAGRRRPGRAGTVALGAVVLLALCAAVALWIRARVGTEDWTSAATLESLGAGVVALSFRAGFRRWERGRPLAGEVWLAMVPFRERDEAARHYCVVLRRRLRGADVLQITSQNKDGQDGYLPMPNGLWDVTSGKGHWVETTMPPRRVPYRDFLKDRPQGPCPTATWRLLRRPRPAPAGPRTRRPDGRGTKAAP